MRRVLFSSLLLALAFRDAQAEASGLRTDSVASGVFPPTAEVPPGLAVVADEAGADTALGRKLYSASGPYTSTMQSAFVGYSGIGVVCVYYVGAKSIAGNTVSRSLCGNSGSYTNSNQISLAAILYTPTTASQTVLQWNIGFQASGGTVSSCSTSMQYTQSSETSGKNYLIDIESITGLTANALDTCFTMAGQSSVGTWAASNVGFVVLDICAYFNGAFPTQAQCLQYSSCGWCAASSTCGLVSNPSSSSPTAFGGSCSGSILTNSNQPSSSQTPAGTPAPTTSLPPGASASTTPAVTPSAGSTPVSTVSSSNAPTPGAAAAGDATTTSNNNNSASAAASSVGAIVGGVVGGIVALAVITAVVVVVLRRTKGKRAGVVSARFNNPAAAPHGF